MNEYLPLLSSVLHLGEICYKRPVQNTAEHLCVPWNHCRESHTFLMATTKITFTRVLYTCVTFRQKRMAWWNVCTVSQSTPFAGLLKSSVCFSHKATIFSTDSTVSAVNLLKIQVCIKSEKNSRYFMWRHAYYIDVCVCVFVCVKDYIGFLNYHGCFVTKATRVSLGNFVNIFAWLALLLTSPFINGYHGHFYYDI